MSELLTSTELHKAVSGNRRRQPAAIKPNRQRRIADSRVGLWVLGSKSELVLIVIVVVLVLVPVHV